MEKTTHTCAVCGITFQDSSPWRDPIGQPYCCLDHLIHRERFGDVLRHQRDATPDSELNLPGTGGVRQDGQIEQAPTKEDLPDNAKTGG